jgi:nucleotidyltransferase-like protein
VSDVTSPPSSARDLCAVILAAGAGLRLRPLTLVRPKPLCPVGNRALVDLAVDRVAPLTGAGTGAVAVNVHHGRDAIGEHFAGSDVHLSIEEDEVLGTAGALGHLRDWIAGRGVVVVNADTWCPASLAPLLDGWDGERVRVAVTAGEGFGPGARVAGALMPWPAVEPLEPKPAGLYEVSWRHHAAEGRLDSVGLHGPCIDCGTPARYLAANLASAGGRSVVAPGAVVEGTVERSVVWDGAVVQAEEHLVDAIRADNRLTVFVR